MNYRPLLEAAEKLPENFPKTARNGHSTVPLGEDLLGLQLWECFLGAALLLLSHCFAGCPQRGRSLHMSHALYRTTIGEGIGRHCPVELVCLCILPAGCREIQRPESFLCRVTLTRETMWEETRDWSQADGIEW